MNSLTCLRGLVPVCRALRVGTVLALFSMLLATTMAQTPATRGDGDRRRGGGTDENGGRRPPSAQDMQARMLATLRERFGVANDDEWAVISERLGKVMELRRTTTPGMVGGGFRGPGGPGGGGGGGPGGGDASRFRGRPGGGSPESEALQSALVDKLPEAELKARLARLRETRKANEKKLEQAQEEFRAVLTVRQEAIAVLMGLVP